MASSRSVVTKTLLGLIVLSVLSLLFLRTLRDSVSRRTSCVRST